MNPRAKKRICFALMILLALSLCACHGEEESAENGQEWTSITAGQVDEILYEIKTEKDSLGAARGIELSPDLVEDLVAILPAHPDTTPSDEDASSGVDGLFPVEEYHQTISLSDPQQVARNVYACGDGSLGLDEYEGELVRSVHFPGLMNESDFQAWQARLGDWLTNGRADALYDLGAMGSSMEVLEGNYLLEEVGIRTVLPMFAADLGREGNRLTFLMKVLDDTDERAMYYLTRKDLFEQVFDQFLKEASLRTIAVLDDIDTIAYIYPDGTEGPVVSASFDRPTREQFRDLYLNGFDSLRYNVDQHSQAQVNTE